MKEKTENVLDLTGETRMTIREEETPRDACMHSKTVLSSVSTILLFLESLFLSSQEVVR